MKRQPSISIITVCFDAEATIAACLKSVRDQSYRDYEHIVVDGGSSDYTTTILAKATTDTPCLKWFSETDDGISDAMNKGIELARGDWLLFLQADDCLYDKDVLSAAGPFLDSPADLLLYNVEVFSPTAPPRIWLAQPQRWRRKIPASHQGMLFRAASVKALQGYNTRYRLAMDYDLIYRLLVGGAQVKVAHQTLSRISSTGLTGSNDWPSQRARFAEERRVHFLNCEGFFWKLFYHLYWAAYFPYRWVLNRFG